LWTGCALAFAATAMAGTVTAAAPPPLSDYGKLAAADQVRISPSGDKIAYAAFQNGKPKLVVSKLDGPVLISADLGDQKLRDVLWLDNDHILAQTTKYVFSDVFTSSQAEVATSIIVNTATLNPLIVFKGHPKIFPTTYGYFGRASKAGKSFAFFGGLTLGGSGSAFMDFDTNQFKITHNHTDLYKVDTDTGDPEAISYGSERRDTEWVVDAGGGIVARAEYDERDTTWRLYGDAGDRSQVTTAPDPTGDIDVLGLGRTPDSILVAQPSASTGDFERIEYRMRPNDPGSRPFGDAGIGEDIRDPLSGLLIGGVTNSDTPRTILFDPALQAKFDKVARALAPETVTLTSTTPNLDRMIVLAEGPGDSGTYFLVDLAGGKVQAVAWRYPSILQDAVGAIRIVDYKAADGLQMQGILTLPPGRDAKSLPLVVLPHGGPEARDYARFDWWAQAFASRGYAVFQPNFRGSDGFGKAFRDAGHGEWGRKMQTDVSDGVAELARQGLVDPKRACIVGASYGGYVALAGVTVQQGLYRCAVSVAGLSDLNAFLFWREEKFGQTGQVDRIDHLFMGVTSAGDSSLRSLSPAHLASRADAPVLLVHGKDDTVVPIEQSLIMRDALSGAGKPVELVLLTGEDHWLSKAATRTQMLEESVSFVEKYNPSN